MTREDICLMGCLFAINKLTEKGSSYYAIKVDNKWEKVPWDEIKEYIESQYGIKVRESE